MLSFILDRLLNKTTEAQAAIQDAINCGTGILKDGKRIDPRDMYPEAQAVEPVAWKDKTYGNLHHSHYGQPEGYIPLYTHPTPKDQAVSSEPVAWMWVGADMGRYFSPFEFGVPVAYKDVAKRLYETPPNHREAMEKALEALEWMYGGEPCKTEEAIAALKETLK